MCTTSRSAQSANEDTLIRSNGQTEADNVLPTKVDYARPTNCVTARKVQGNRLLFSDFQADSDRESRPFSQN